MKFPRPQSLNGLILVGFGLVALPLLIAVIWALVNLDRTAQLRSASSYSRRHLFQHTTPRCSNACEHLKIRAIAHYAACVSSWRRTRKISIWRCNSHANIGNVACQRLERRSGRAVALPTGVLSLPSGMRPVMNWARGRMGKQLRTEHLEWLLRGERPPVAVRWGIHLALG